nr:DNA polymerase UL30 [Psittacid alphaherpesvirus 6]
METACRERQPVVPRSFYNPFIAAIRGNSSTSSRRGQATPRHNRSHTYVSDIDEFKFVAPKSLDTDLEDGGDEAIPKDYQKGTHIGVLRRKPIVYHGEETFHFLDYEACTGKLWPTRTSVWAGKWHGPSDFDPRFFRFHVYDIMEEQETITLAQQRADSPRFMSLVDPIGTIVTLLGMTECGKRVAVHVYGERPYFYMRKSEVDAACGSTCPSDLIDKMVTSLRDMETSDFGGTRQNTGPFTRNVHARCFDVDVVSRADIYYYGTPEESFYRVRTSSSKYIHLLCDNFCPSVTKYEGQVDVITRFVLDHKGFVSFGWYRVKNGHAGEKVQIRNPLHHSTSCDVEINCTADNLIGEPDDVEWPLGYKLASFDIECKAGGEVETAFPVADKVEDVIIQISCLLYSLHDRKLEKVLLFTLGSCDLPDGCISEVRAATADGSPPAVFEFDSEFELLLAFATFLKQYAPEFVTGYNIINFDWPYVYNKLVDVYGLRMDGYGILNRCGMFKIWDAGTNRFQKKSKVKINGMITVDMYSIASEKLRLCSYKLDAVAEAALGERKKDLPYKEIPERFASGPRGRGSIGDYCIRDSLLVGKLFFKFLPHLELSAVAKLAGILLSRAIYDGQQIRVFTCILRLACNKGFILPDHRPGFISDGRKASTKVALGNQNKSLDHFGGPSSTTAVTNIGSTNDDSGYCTEDCDNWDAGSADYLFNFGEENATRFSESETTDAEPSDISGDVCENNDLGTSCSRKADSNPTGHSVGYQGATVLDPAVGFHVDPVTVFDFASLYPSIIQAHNLCFTTLAPSLERVAHLHPEKDYFEINVLGKTLYFVRPHVRGSLLAALLNDWLAMRKSIRARMAEIDDEDQTVLLDKQQAAIKVVCNSVYGFCGVSNGFLPCVDVAATVTTIGRQMLFSVRDYIHKEWSSVEALTSAFPSMTKDLAITAVNSDKYRCEVVYGDTDSVFVRFTGMPVETLVRCGTEMARSISDALFSSPIKLECEKTFTKLLLITKKKYIGIVTGGKMIMKGVELVRRNNCRFINNYSRRLVDLLFRDDKVAAAAAEIASYPPERWTTRPLPGGIKPFAAVLVEAYNRVALPTSDPDVKDFIMSAELSRPVDAYVNRRIAHITVYYKLKMRAEQEPAVKDRISYVIAEPSEQLERDAEAVARLRGDAFQPQSTTSIDTTDSVYGTRKRKLIMSDLAEDPRYITEKKARLSTEYYFSHLIGSLTVTFKALFNNNTKITELVLRRFIPETFYENEEETKQLEKAGFRTISIGATRGAGQTVNDNNAVSWEGENHRTLHTALRILTTVHRLC